jgi:hypothetical protein
VPPNTSPRLFQVGRVAFAVAVAAFGAENLVVGDFLPELEPVPAWLPARTALAYFMGAVLVAAGASMVSNRRLRGAARVVMSVFAVVLIAAHAPRLIADPRNGGAWAIAFETFALGAVAAILAVPSRPNLGRLCYGLSLPAFGGLHFVFRDYVASVIPGWIPGHMFWAYATGVALIAAGAAIVFDVKARLAAILLGAMFGTWVVILHVPRALAALDHRPEWTSLFVALGMCGGAWLLTGHARGAAVPIHEGEVRS